MSNFLLHSGITDVAPRNEDETLPTKEMVYDPRLFINEFEGETVGLLKPNPLYFTLMTKLKFECGPHITEDEASHLTANAITLLLRTNRQTGHGQLVVLAGMEDYESFWWKYSQTEFFVSTYFLHMEELEGSGHQWNLLGFYAHSRKPNHLRGFTFDTVFFGNAHSHMTGSQMQRERRGW